MKEKSHKGQRHKGCALCDQEKRAGNAAERRPARDRRQIEGAKTEGSDASVRTGFVGALIGTYGTSEDVQAFVREERAAWGE